MHNPLTWTDHPGGSIRSDGVKVSEFVIDGHREIWAYPADWRPGRNCPDHLQPIGPFDSYKHAKQEAEWWLGLKS